MLTDPCRLWQLISPALPVGAFHYSQGLETAIARKCVYDAATALHWIGGVFAHVITHLDLPIICRAYRAWNSGDEAAVIHWSSVSRACRETSELRAEDDAMGGALGELCRSLADPFPGRAIGFAAAFAVSAANASIPLREVLSGYAWAWCENQVLVAARAVPLGHVDSQRLLRRLSANIAAGVDAAEKVVDEDVGRAAPGLALASMYHETQYSRLFRS